MTTEAPGDEVSLVLRAQDGDAAAFERLVDIHQGRLFRIAYLVVGDRQDAEDVVQEALILAWKRLHLLDEPGAFRGWVARICTHGATDVVRRRVRRATDPAPTEDLDVVGDGPERRGCGTRAGTATGDPAATAVVNAQLEALTRILATLDPALRACWVLREIDGMSYREISRVVDATEPTVRGRIARARTRITQQMQTWR